MAQTNGMGGSKAQARLKLCTLINDRQCSSHSRWTGSLHFFFSTRLLDVGAVKPDNYHSCASWIDVTPIDLHSRHPSILEQDFLRMDQESHREAWDIISLSLVLNFVPDGRDRGTLLLAMSGLVIAN